MGYGNKQLFVRGFIQIGGIVLYFLRGYLTQTRLHNTRFKRSPIESAALFYRALLLVPLTTGSLFHQWYTEFVLLKTEQEYVNFRR